MNAALPRSIPRSLEVGFTGATCPECFGSLRVQSEGAHQRVTFQWLTFQCRIAHTYSTDEVAVAKER